MTVRAAEWTEGVRWVDLLELTKPRITMMVVMTTALGSFLAGQTPFPIMVCLHAMIGVALLAGGAATLNQVIEREPDALMERTAHRPVASGRVDPRRASQFGIALSVLGLLYLIVLANLLTALVGALTLWSYLFLYTPLKRRTPWATLVGAVPGALPPLMGWTAVRGEVESGAWMLFGILLLWQLPHSLAIAWLYRRDYERGGFAILPVGDPAGVRTSRQMVAFCLALLVMSLLPWALGSSGLAYLVGASLFGFLFLGSCVFFAASRTRSAARQVMLVSILYLPAVLTMMAVDQLV